MTQLQTDRIDGWFEAARRGSAPVDMSAIAGGLSNITYRVNAADGTRWVLRRPPFGHVLPTAHDMGREYRIMAALAPTPVPVPDMLGLCTDPSVWDSQFYVMRYVDGRIIRTQDDAEDVTAGDRLDIGMLLMDTLADIHEVDVTAVGLSDMARPGSYVERQLRRWYRQWEDSKVRPSPLIEEVHQRLVACVPADSTTRLIHGDFRIDNLILRPDLSGVAAVLDWELAALGDPFADLGLTMAYWNEPTGLGQISQSPTDLPGFPSREDAIARYAARRAISVDDSISFFVAFAHWKVACITEGVYARYRAGVMGDAEAVDMKRLELTPEIRADAARRALNGEL